MFELTVRGITKQFETAEEMEEWRQRMRDVKPRRKKKREKKVKVNNLKNIIKKT